MSMRRLLTWRAAVLPLAFIASSATVHAQAHITSPKEFFGHNIGDDYWLPNYDQFLTYWKKMDSESNRMQAVEIGKSSEGRPHMAAMCGRPSDDFPISTACMRFDSLSIFFQYVRN